MVTESFGKNAEFRRDFVLFEKLCLFILIDSLSFSFLFDEFDQSSCRFCEE